VTGTLGLKDGKVDFIEAKAEKLKIPIGTNGRYFAVDRRLAESKSGKSIADLDLTDMILYRRVGFHFRARSDCATSVVGGRSRYCQFVSTRWQRDDGLGYRHKKPVLSKQASSAAWRKKRYRGTELGREFLQILRRD